MRCFFLIPVILAGVASAESVAEVTAAGRQASARARMEAAIARQKQTVKRQLGRAQTGDDSFFTVPWQQPLAPVAGPAGAPHCPALPAGDVDRLVSEAAKREDLPADLLRSVMAQESGFYPCAVSSKGAQGLMQLMPDTAAQLGVKDPFDPVENVASGAKLLKSLLQRYGGNVQAALGAYNAGPGRVDAAGGGVPPILETVQYVQRILAALGH
jgi:soluble lytic murein transglycosylase-like protein